MQGLRFGSIAQTRTSQTKNDDGMYTRLDQKGTLEQLSLASPLDVQAFPRLSGEQNRCKHVPFFLECLSFIVSIRESNGERLNCSAFD